MARLNREQRRDYARRLFLQEKGITQKEIASRVGVTEATVSRWAKDEGWNRLRTSLLTTKEEQLAMMYQQLEAANRTITTREATNRFPSSKEADAILKLTAAIGKLETETNIGDKMATGKDFLIYVRRVSDFEFSKEIATLFDQYIKTQLK